MIGPGLLRVLAVLLLALALPVQAVLLAAVDRNVIEEGETLTLRLQRDARGEDPDFERLEQDFQVLGNQRTESYRSINGRSSQVIQWRLTLLPKRTGIVRIPAFTADGDRSEPIEIQVRPISLATRQLIQEQVYFDNAVDTDTVWVRGQLIYTIRLFYAEGVQLYVNLPGAPDLPDAIVEPLGERTNYKKRLPDGRVYDVTEQRYAIFPQRSGPLTLPAVSVTGGMRLPRELQQSLRQRTVTIRSEPIEVTVRPQPADYPDAPWLPAHNVELVQRIDPERMQMRDPVKRDVLLIVDGMAANLLPALELPVTDRSPPGGDGVRTYPERPVSNDDVTRTGLRGTRLETMTIIPGAESGTITVGAVRLPWWNVDTGTLQWAELPARSFQVVDAAGRPARPEAPDTQTTSTPRAEPAGTAAATDAPSSTAPVPQATGEPGGFALLGWLLWLVTLAVAAAVWWLGRWPRRPDVRHDDTGDSGASALLSRLKQAVRAGDAAAAERLLGRWLRATGAPESSNDLRQHCLQLGCAAPDAVMALRAHCYARTAPSWDGAALLDWVRDFDRARAGAARQQRARADALLPPLHPAR